MTHALVAILGVGLFSAPVFAEDDSITPDLLPGVDLVTEEVEPGVHRVVNDGLRDLGDISGLTVPTEAGSASACRTALLVDGECWANAYGMLVREVDGEFPLEQVPDAEHGLTYPSQEVIGPLPGSDDTGWLLVTGPTGFQGLLGYDAEGWARVPYTAGEDGRALSIDADSACGVVLGPSRHPALVGPDGTVWIYTLGPDGLLTTTWDGVAWSSYGPVDIGVPDIVDPCLLLDAAFGPGGPMWFTTWRIPLYVITPKAVAGTE